MTSGVWISIDGVEGAGKTTLADALLRRSPNAARVSEFSDGPLGRLLASAVRDEPHHISPSAGGQSLVFLGEFWQRCDVEVAAYIDAGKVVIHDRGYLSKFAYQYAVLEPALGDGALALLSAIFTHLPKPDLSVRLTAPIETIESRLIVRDGRCEERRLNFIRRADAVFRKPPIELGDTLLLDSSVETPEALADRVVDYLQ